MAFNDWNGDGKKDLFDDMIEYQIYRETMGENDDNISYGNHNHPFNSSNKNSNAKLQRGYNIFVIGALLLVGIVAPIYTVFGLIVDPKYFFNDASGIFLAIIAFVELIALIVYLCSRIKKK